MINTLQGLARNRGWVKSLLLVVLAVLIAGGLWLYVDEDAARDVKKKAELVALEAIGDAATRRIGGDSDGEASHGSAVELIKRPIEVQQVAENVYMATGVGNVIMVTTSEGNVLFDTGLVLQTPRQLAALPAGGGHPVRAAGGVRCAYTHHCVEPFTRGSYWRNAFFCRGRHQDNRPRAV